MDCVINVWIDGYIHIIVRVSRLSIYILIQLINIYSYMNHQILRIAEDSRALNPCSEDNT
jgi:hypothetical protein